MVPWIPAQQQKPWLTAVQKPWLKQNQQQKGGGKGGGKGAFGAWNQIPNFGGWGQQSWPFNMMQQMQPWRQQRKPPPGVPANYKVDQEQRYTGTVSFYHKWKGYGFIELAESGVVPQDKLFVHWRNIQSDDRYPFLVKDLEVEFGVQKWTDKWAYGVTTLRAKFVTLSGGTNIAMQDDIDAQEKDFVGGQHLRYTGTCKFFDPRRGFGWVNMDQGYDVPADVASELRVDKEEVNSGGRRPTSMNDLAVEFGIWKTPKGEYKVYNMTLPGGHPLTQDALENRITMGVQNYQGTVAIWNWRQGWGFIRADPTSVLPPRVVTKLAQQTQAAIARGKTITSDAKMFYFRRTDCTTGFDPRKEMQVSFQLYIDDKGAGACEVINLSD